MSKKEKNVDENTENQTFKSTQEEVGIKPDDNIKRIHSFDNANSFSFNMPKIESSGEDADPYCLINDRYALLSVFDGLGGAGSQKITIEDRTESSAYFASRLVRKCMDSFFLQNLSVNLKKSDFSNNVPSFLKEEFCTFLKTKLKQFISDNEIPSSKLKSSLIKALPTTLASLLIFNKENSTLIDCYSFWAGDSRAYIFNASNGLQQLTKDDLKQEGDAFDNLFNDSKMSNFISPDLDFKINVGKFVIDTPSIFLVCSDGCFDYLPTPMDFEYLLLDTMQNSKTLTEWSDKIKSDLGSIPVGDDCSLCLFYHGWKGIDDMQRSFLDRYLKIKTEYINVVNVLRNEAKEFNETIEFINDSIGKLEEQKKEPKEKLERKEKDVYTLSKSLWENYKENYTQFLKDENSDR